MRNKKYEMATDENYDPILGADDPAGVGYGQAAAAGVIGVPRAPRETNRSAGMDEGGMASVDFAAEDAYWRTNYAERPYVGEGEPYEMYEPGYRIGYEHFARYEGQSFDEIEEHLQSHYEENADDNDIGWERAREASRDSWERMGQAR